MLIKYILTYTICLLVLLFLDAAWLYSSSTFYKEYLGHLLGNTFLLKPALFFYPIYAFGIFIFAIYPALLTNSSVSYVLLRASLLALCSYGAYDFTNHATLKDWPLIVTIVDLCWGVFVTSLTSSITYAISKFYLYLT